VPSPRARRALIVGGVLLAGGTVLASAFGGRHVALQRVEAAMEARQLTWAGTDHALNRFRWLGLQRGPHSCDAIELDPLGRRVLATGVQVDLRALDRIIGGGGEDGEDGEGGGLTEGRTRHVAVEGVRLSWGDRLVADDLSGTLSPKVALGGQGFWLQETDTGVEAHLERPLDLGWLAGTASLALAHTDGTVTLDLDVPDLLVRHDLLDDKAPLGPFALSADGELDLPTGTLALEIEALGAHLALDGTVGWEPVTADLQLQMTEVELPILLAQAPLRTHIPEARLTETRGTIAFRGQLAGPPWRVWGTPQLDGLKVQGLLPGDGSLREGGITWTVDDAAGNTTLLRRGPLSPHWVRPDEARPVVDAIVAAEDAGFFEHEGYDTAAMAEALAAMADDRAQGDPVRVRGASTLTQQLAKNLFLSGERTLTRKVRELLYAVELDHSLGKERVLELYLNIVELGPDIRGVGEAADAYFLKRPAALTPREAAWLALLLPSPRTTYVQSYLSERPPLGRIDAIVDAMVDTGALSSGQAARAKSRPLRFVPPEQPR